LHGYHGIPTVHRTGEYSVGEVLKGFLQAREIRRTGVGATAPSALAALPSYPFTG